MSCGDGRGARARSCGNGRLRPFNRAQRGAHNADMNVILSEVNANAASKGPGGTTNNGPGVLTPGNKNKSCVP